MVKKKYIPKRGDVVWTNFDLASGHEQMGKRRPVCRKGNKQRNK